MQQKDKNDKVLQQFRGKLKVWSNKNLSMVGRILITNQVILLSIWYIASCTNLSQIVL